MAVRIEVEWQVVVDADVPAHASPLSSEEYARRLAVTSGGRLERRVIHVGDWEEAVG